MPDLPWHKEEMDRDSGDLVKLVERLITQTVESMYALSEENQYLEVTYANGDKETFYMKDFSSGALIEGIVSRGKKYAIKRLLATGERGLKADDLLRAIRDEFKEHEDLPNTTNPDLLRAIRDEFKEHEDLPNTTNPGNLRPVVGIGRDWNMRTCRTRPIPTTGRRLPARRPTRSST